MKEEDIRDNDAFRFLKNEIPAQIKKFEENPVANMPDKNPDMMPTNIPPLPDYNEFRYDG